MRRPLDRRARPAALRAALLGAAALVLAACDAGGPEPTPSLVEPTTTPPPAQEPTDQPEPPEEEPEELLVPGPELPDATDEPTDVVSGLAAPWDLEFLPGGAVVVTTRDEAQLLLLRDTGLHEVEGLGAEELRETTETAGEGGLLGVAAVPQDGGPGDGTVDLLLYRTAATGNEVVRATLDPESAELGSLVPVIQGIPAGGTHNGGRIAVGPDQMLWVATGDAGIADLSQDPESLAGKVLRLTLDGDPALDNPEPGSPVWSLGHRNVQGLAWDADGNLVASEFGQNRIDELNVLVAGGNYGWPEVEGTGGGPDLVDPVVTWSPADSSPSGIAATDDAVYVAALRGQRLWRVPWADGGPDGEPTAHLEGELGRLRHVELGPDGALWLLTQNTDGRGAPRDGDDRLVRVLPP